MSSPVEVVHLGGVQDAATCGISDGSLNLSEEFKTLVGESVTLASSTLSEVFKTHADPALPNLSEEFKTLVGDLSEEIKTLVGESVTLASSKAAS